LSSEERNRFVFELFGKAVVLGGCSARRDRLIHAILLKGSSGNIKVQI
jgi:hypothetical protein